MFWTTSSRDMPTPLSDTATVRAFRSKETRIFSSASDPYKALSESAWKRSLSAASEAFDISSLRKTSLLPYREWIMRWSSCFTSAWKPRVSFVAAVAIAKPPPIQQRAYEARREAVQPRRPRCDSVNFIRIWAAPEFLEPGRANVYAGGSFRAGGR